MTKFMDSMPFCCSAFDGVNDGISATRSSPVMLLETAFAIAFGAFTMFVAALPTAIAPPIKKSPHEENDWRPATAPRQSRPVGSTLPSGLFRTYEYRFQD